MSCFLKPQGLAAALVSSRPRFGRKSAAGSGYHLENIRLEIPTKVLGDNAAHIFGDYRGGGCFSVKKLEFSHLRNISRICLRGAKKEVVAEIRSLEGNAELKVYTPRSNDYKNERGNSFWIWYQ